MTPGFRLHLLVSTLVTTSLLLFLCGCPGDTSPDDLCEGLICDAPPSAGCDGAVVVTYGEAGTCSEGECEYPQTRTPCPEAHHCSNGECLPGQGRPPCEDVVCDEPPANYCEDGVLFRDAAGICEENEGRAACVYYFTEQDCGQDEMVCAGEAGDVSCVDLELCLDVDCSPRQDYCSQDTAFGFGGAAGACDWRTGDCEYPADDESILPCEEDAICWVGDAGNAACVPDPAGQLCVHSCTEDADCGRDIDPCVELATAEGPFCLLACEDEGDCDAGYSCQPITSVDGTSASSCVPTAGYCLVPSCFVGSFCAHPHCKDHFACVPGFNFDFENWQVSDPPAGFAKSSEEDFQVTMESSVVNDGARSARVETRAGTQERRLRVHRENRIPAAAGETYTLHQWTRLPGPTGSYRIGLAHFGQDDEPQGELELGLEIAAHDVWQESTLPVTAPPVMPPGPLTSMEPFLSIRQVGSNDPEPTDPADPVVVFTDDWAITSPYSFDVNSQTTDQSAVIVAGGRTFLQAAINSAGVLYAATNLPGNDESNDRMLFVWVGGVGRTMVSPPLGKSGSLAGPPEEGVLLALIQDEQRARCEWRLFDTEAATPAEAWVTLSGGDFCPLELGYTLSGTVHLPGLLGVEANEIPAHISFAAGAYAATNGHGLIGQIPSSTDADGDLQPAETVRVHRASFLAGKVHR